MGLDITAYRQLKDAGPESEETEENWDTTVRFWTIPEFESAADPVDCSRQYTFAEKFSFQAGSYSGYNRWRERLCKFAFNTDTETVWSNPMTFEGRPFYRLINFADNEGTIGSVAAKKLADDFEKYESAFVEFCANDADDWDLSRYRGWMKAFRMAADGGAVSFH